MPATYSQGAFINPACVDTEGINLRDWKAEPPSIGANKARLPEAEIRRFAEEMDRAEVSTADLTGEAADGELIVELRPAVEVIGVSVGVV